MKSPAPKNDVNIMVIGLITSFFFADDTIKKVAEV